MTFDKEMNLLEAERLTGILEAIFKGREQLSLYSAELSGISGTIMKLKSSINKALGSSSSGDEEFS